MGTKTQEIKHVPAGEGRTVEIGTATTIFKLVSADTADMLALWEGVVPPGFGSPSPHAHPESETFYLLEGELEFIGINQNGRYTFRVGSGATVHIPGGAAHQFVNVGAVPSRVLVITAPGGLERYLGDFAAALPADTPPNEAMADPCVREKVAALDAKYGVGYVHTDDLSTLGTGKNIVHIPAEGGKPAPIGAGRLVLTGEGTAGAITLFDGVFPPGAGSPGLHTHGSLLETFYVLEGEAEFTGMHPGGVYTFCADSDSVVHVPAGTPHHFVNAGAAPLHTLVITMPGGFERYFADIAAALPTGIPPEEAVTDPQVRERIAAIDARYGIEYVRLPEQQDAHRKD